MQDFLPTTNTTPGLLAVDYLTQVTGEGYNQVRNDKLVEYSIQPVIKNVDGAPNPFIPDHQTGDEYSMAIGNFDQAPTEGTVALSVGSTTTGAIATIPATVTAAALQSALNIALTTEGKPNAQVLSLGNGSYIITATSNGAITDGFFGIVNTALLYPISNAFFTKDSNGSVSSPYRYLFTMRQAPMCYSEPDTELPATDVVVEATQNYAAGQSVVRTILFTVPQVSAGAFTVSATATSTDATCGTATPLMSARDFGILLANHPNINFGTPGFEDNISVTKSGQSWAVTAIGDLDDDSTFEIVATNSPDDPLIGPRGLSGEINYNTFGLLAYSRSQEGETFTLTRQIQRYRGTETRTLYSGPVTIYKELIDASTAVPTPTINYYTASQVDSLLLDKMDTDFGNVAGTLAITNGGTGETTATAAINALLPSQTGNSGKSLKTDGTVASWAEDVGARLVGRVTGTSETNPNSTTMKNSTQAKVTLGVGTWDVEIRAIVGDSMYASAGTKTTEIFTGTSTFDGNSSFRGTFSAETPLNAGLTYAGVPGIEPNSNFFDTITAPGQSLIVEKKCTLVVTSPGDLILQFAQNSATASTCSLFIGSYVEATKIS